MQVAVFEQEASSAALGAQEALEVTMTSDASFMTMMFSNLYTNQVLASVREPICNAWDAMIDANKADQCIDITFDRESGDLSIRDYGFGIPKEKIASIYGVFGGSTKRTDSKTTGGFGLGSKAPWALVESFRVTSRNNGNMSVYNMAKSTLESQGKPMIVPMVDVPCSAEDTGLMVQFRVPADKMDQVQDYIQYVVLMGDIKARWNGEEMHTIELSTEPGSYTIDQKWFNKRMFTSRSETIFIRYGTVVYPILRVPGTEKAIALLTEFMSILDIERVLIQAAPSSLGLTPARESLSSGPLTENGLTQLCVDLIAKIEKEITETLPESLAKVERDLRETWIGKEMGNNNYRGIMEPITPDNYLPPMQRKFYRSKLGRTFRNAWESRLELAEHIGWKKQAKAKFPKHFDILNKIRHFDHHEWIKFGTPGANYESDYYNSYNEEIFNTKCFIPSLKQIGRSGLDLNKVQWSGVSSYRLDLHDIKHKDNTYRKYPCARHSDSHLILKLIESLENKNIVIYSGVLDKCCFLANPALVSDLSEKKHAFVIKVKSDDDLTQEIAKLKTFGFTVTDLRLEHDWDPKVIKAKEKKKKARLALEKARETRRKKAEALKAAGIVDTSKPRMQNALGTLRNFLGLSQSKMEILKPEFTTDTPLYYLTPAELNNNYVTSMWYAEWLTEEEKDNIIVVRNGVETKMAEKRGATKAEAYFAAKLFAIVSEPGFKKYFSKLRRKSLSEQHSLSSSLFRDLEALGIKVTGLDKLTHNVIYEQAADLYNSCWSKLSRLITPELTEKQVEDMKALSNIRLDIPVVQKLKSVRDDQMLKGIMYYTHDSDDLRGVLKRYPERKQALKIIALSAYNRKDS